MHLEEILSRLKGVQHVPGSDHAMALCPAHGDKNPSLSVRETDGRILAKCFAGCEYDAIIAAMGLTAAELHNGAHSAAVPTEHAARDSKREAPDPGQLWASYAPAPADNAYLAKKRIKPHGARVNAAGLLVVPFVTREGAIQTLQTISGNGRKLFLKGPKAKGSAVILGEPHGADVVVVAEGFATAATIEEATGYPVIAAGSLDSLLGGAQMARHFAPQGRVVIAADRGDQTAPRAAARAVDGFLATFGPENSRDGFDANDFKLAGASDEEIRAVIDAAPKPEATDTTSKAAAVPVPPPVIPWVWLEDATLPPQSSGPVKGLIDKGTVVLVYGPPKSGKTFFVFDLVAHVAMGLPWRGRRTSGGLVIYVAAEAGRSIIRRCVAWRDRFVGDAREARVPLAIVTRAVNLLHMGDLGEFLNELKRIVEAFGQMPAVVVFDTLSRSTPGGDENSSETMSTVVGVADMIRDEFGAVTIIVHHCGKDATRGARGHTTLAAACDLIINVVDCVATVEDSRDAVAGEQFAFSLEPVELGRDEDNAPITTCLVCHDVAPPPAKADSRRQLAPVAQVALRALHESIADHGESLPATSVIPRPVRGVTLDNWRTQFALRYGEDTVRTPDAVDKGFRRGRDGLLKVNLVEIATPYAWIP